MHITFIKKFKKKSLKTTSQKFKEHKKKYYFFRKYKFIRYFQNINLKFILMLQLTTKCMNKFMYSITIRFIPNNKDYNLCHYLYSVY